MASLTPILGLVNLDVGQTQKEATINKNNGILDNAIVRTESVTGGADTVSIQLKPTLDPASSTAPYSIGYMSFLMASMPDGHARNYALYYLNNDQNRVGFTIGDTDASGTPLSTQVSDMMFHIVGDQSHLQVHPNFVDLKAAAITLTTTGPLKVNSNAGNPGQVLTSQGGSAAPTWTNPGGYQGELASAPSATGLAPGSTYYNTSTSTLQVLSTTGSWMNAA